MPRYAIKHTPTGKMLELDFCGDNAGILYDESRAFVTYGHKPDAEAALAMMQNSNHPTYVYDHETGSETEHDASEFELVEL